MIKTMAQQMSFDEASKLMNENPNSQLMLVPSKQHIKLSPKYIGSVKSGVTEVLKSQLLLYNRELNGVPVAFRNIKALQRLGLIIADQTCLHLDIEAEFILFKPAMDCILKGIINKVGKKHVGCLVHGCFNGWFPRSDITATGTDTPELELMGREVEFQVLETFSSNRVVSLRGKFHSLISQPNTLKKGKKDKRTLPASTAYLDSLDDSLHIQPIMTSTQIETPTASHEKKKKKQKKVKRANLELSNASENGLDFSDSGVKVELNTSEDVFAMLGSDDSLTRKKKKKKRKSEMSEEVIVKQEVLCDKLDKQEDSKKHKKKKRKSETDKEEEIKQEPVPEVHEQRVKQKKKKKSDISENVIVKEEVFTEDKEVQKSNEKQKKKKKRKSQEVIEEVKQEIVSDNHEVQKNNEKQTKRKNLKRKLQEEELETVQSSDDFISLRKKVKKEKKEKHAVSRDSHGPNDSNNNVTKHKKSKHKK